MSRFQDWENDICLRCNYKQDFEYSRLQKYTCEQCKKNGCPNCFTYNIGRKYNRNLTRYQNELRLLLCSEVCMFRYQQHTEVEEWWIKLN